MKHGFSLVELSIVLVILGLLTGGILAGQSLIRASELRSVTTDFNRYMAATQTFRDKYFALPGDLNNATSFWGTSPGGCPGNSTTPASDARTCDGNSNGIINALEAYRYWQHLANAGLIEGTYTGVSGGAVTTYTSLIGTNVPSSKLSNAAFSTWTRDSTNAGNTNEFAGEHGNLYFFGGAIADGITAGAVLRPEETWNIDTKMDDGRPGYGKVLGYRISTCTNAGTPTTFDADYQLSSNAITCSIMFRKLF